MILAAAQPRSFRKDIDANLLEHYAMIEQAAKEGADLVLFPELSITGYERDYQHEELFGLDDARLGHLKELAVKHQIVIVIGAPVQIDKNNYIGAFIIGFDGKVDLYTKQFVHPGEDLFFKSSFNHNPLIEIANERMSIAICADINHMEHPLEASKRATTVYLASIFFEPYEMEKAFQILSGYAKKYDFPVLMSNYTGSVWESEGGGKSAFWNSSGDLIGNMEGVESGIIFVENNEGSWRLKAIKKSDF